MILVKVTIKIKEDRGKEGNLFHKNTYMYFFPEKNKYLHPPICFLDCTLFLNNPKKFQKERNQPA